MPRKVDCPEGMSGKEENISRKDAKQQRPLCRQTHSFSQPLRLCDPLRLCVKLFCFFPGLDARATGSFVEGDQSGYSRDRR